MTTYSISLDDIDLALLPLRARTFNTDNFLKKEYYQFKVMKEETVEETTSTRPSVVTYTCNICAIEVPAAFANEHDASIKHRANARIASVAAQRTRALIYALPPPSAELPNARFCANCTAVVDEDHAKTKEHRVAVMHDNLLRELTNAYADDKKKNEDRDKSQNNDHKKSVSSNAVVGQIIDNNETTQKTAEKTDKKQVRDTSPVAESSNFNDKNLNTKDKEINVDDTSIKTARIENRSVNGNVLRSHTKDDYEKELRKFMDTNNPFEIKELYNRIHIKIKNGTLNVYSDHFHSYHRLYYDDGKTECIVCNCTFSYKEAEAHKYDLNHMTRVAQIGNDGHYVREINESYSHCILCNQKIKNTNVAVHNQSKHHIVRKTNNTKAISNNPKTQANTAEKTANDTQHGNAVNEKNTDNTSEVGAESNNVTGNLIEYPYVEDRGVLWCVVCDCKVPRDLTNRKYHVKGARHVNNMKQNQEE